MDQRLIYIKALTLWYRESHLPNHVDNNSSQLIKDVVSLIKLPENNIIIDSEFGRDVSSNLRSTLMNLLNSTYQPIDKAELLQRVRVNVGQEDGLYRALYDAIDDDIEEPEARKVCESYRSEFMAYLRRAKVKEIVKDVSLAISFHEDNIDWRHFVKDMMTRLEPYRNDESKTKHQAVVDDFNFNDFSTIMASMENAQNDLSTDGVMRFGTQAINRMFGESQGIRRGEFLVLGALQHNYKSGMCLQLMKQMMLQNVPYMRDPTKKPMIMRISLENKVTDDLYWLYVSLMENETKQKVDLKTVSYEEVVAVVADRLQKTGYTLNMCRIDPTDFTYHDLFERIHEYESQGYEIHAVFIDYLNMMSKKGCTMGAQGQEVRDLFRRTRNFFSKKGIACVTPHQLSTQAKELIRMGGDNFVQEIANKGYWDSCKTIDQEVDIEIYQHIVKVNGESYLTIQRGKHRKITITNPNDLYTVLKFEEIGGILDDVGGRDTSRRKVGGNTMADGGGDAWYTS